MYRNWNEGGLWRLEGDQVGDPKGWKQRNWAGEAQCAGPKQLLPASSVYSRGLGSVRTGRTDSHRIGGENWIRHGFRGLLLA